MKNLNLKESEKTVLKNIGISDLPLNIIDAKVKLKKIVEKILTHYCFVDFSFGCCSTKKIKLCYC